jgi:hypothetical protein
METLPNEVLLLIFSFLPPKSWPRLALVCKRWNSNREIQVRVVSLPVITEAAIKSKYLAEPENIYQKKDWILTEQQVASEKKKMVLMRKLLPNFEYLEKLYQTFWKSSYTSIFYLEIPDFTHLTTLKCLLLPNSDIDDAKLEIFCTKNPHLEHLDLVFCRNLTPKVFHYLGKLPKLVTLRISQQPPIDLLNDWAGQLISLSICKISICSKLLHILSTFKKLKYTSFYECDFSVSQTDYVNYCDQLVTPHLSLTIYLTETAMKSVGRNVLKNKYVLPSANNQNMNYHLICSCCPNKAILSRGRARE